MTQEMAQRMTQKVVGKIVGFLIIILVVVTGFGQAVHYLWNWLMPIVFGLHRITYWQALGLLGLSWLLFGGFGWFGRPGRSMHSGKRMRERFEQMTPEEREKLREGLSGRC